MAPVWHVRGAFAGLDFEVIERHETAKAVCAKPDDRTYNCSVVRLTVWVPEIQLFRINDLEMVDQTGIEPASLVSNYPREFAHRRGKPTGRLVVGIVPQIVP